MKNMIKITLFSLVSTTMMSSVYANDHASMDQKSTTVTASTQQQIIKTKGLVKAIDTENKKLTIAHEPIQSLNWPAMTMRFTYQDPATISAIKVGDQVALDFVQQGNISLISHIITLK